MAEVKLSETDTRKLINSLRKLVENLPAIRVATPPKDNLYIAPMTPQEVEAHNLKIARTRDRRYAPQPYRIDHVRPE
jgi:hypothetical protein